MAESVVASTLSHSSVEEDDFLIQVDGGSVMLQQSQTSSQKSDTSVSQTSGPGWVLGPPRKREGGKESWVWTHGIKIVTQEDGRDWWRCNLCAQKYRASGTDKAAAHIKSKHWINHNGPMARHDSVLIQQRRLSSSGSLLREKVDASTFRTLLLKWIICMHISFSQVESKYFRQMMVYVNPVLESGNLLPKSGNTIRDWVMKDFGKCKEQITRKLAESEGQVHLSFDLWTSPNSLALLGVVGHWMSKDKHLQTTLLGLRRLQGAHSGENMSAVVLDVVKNFRIQTRLGYFVLDNAETNDTCVKSLSDHIDLPVLSGQPFSRRLRCFGHILNLVVKAFLFGNDADAFEVESRNRQGLNDEAAELHAWRKRGSIGKLHNVVMFIRRSPQRMEEFLKIQGNIHTEAGDDSTSSPLLQVVEDNATRWNSTYNMIYRALQVKDAVDVFTTRHLTRKRKDDRTLREDQLTEEDWDILTRILSLLEPFKKLTARMEGRAMEGCRGAIWETLPSMDFLLEHIERAKLEYEHLHKHIYSSLNNAWYKLNNYYSLTDMSPIYVAGVVLNPQYKWCYFEEKWSFKPQWIEEAHKIMKQFWLMYKGKRPMIEVEQSLSTRDMDLLDEFMNTSSRGRVSSAEDEYEQYSSSPPEPFVVSVRDWWKNKRDSDLRAMAFDVLSIPAMSAECERVFSSGKLMLPPQRNRLREDAIEAAELLKAWETAGVVSW